MKKTPAVRRSSTAAATRARRKRGRETPPPCRCLALCIGVILLSSSAKERSASLIGGVGASENQPPPTTSSHRSTSSVTPSRFRFAIPTFRRGFPDDDDDGMGEGSSFFVGAGREFDLFDTRGGVSSEDVGGGDYGTPSSPLHPFTSHPRPHASSPNQPPPSPPSNNNNNNNNTPLGQSSYPSYSTSNANRAGGRAYTSSSNRRRRGSRPSSGWYYRSSTSTAQSGSPFHRAVVEPVQNWWSAHVAPNVKSWPKLTCRVEPTTTLKIRKTFRPIGTIVKFGADFNTQLGVWQFKSSWEDAFLGGKLTLAGRELQLTKSWQLSVTAVEDLVTRLRCRAAVDLQTWKAYVRVGFRTERLSPINVVEGFTILKQIPLDGTKGHVKLEVKAILSLPEPEIEYSTETQRSLVGMGDIEVNVEELNLLLDY